MTGGAPEPPYRNIPAFFQIGSHPWEVFFHVHGVHRSFRVGYDQYTPKHLSQTVEESKGIRKIFRNFSKFFYKSGNNRKSHCV